MLLKYMKHEYALGMVNGEFKIGTLAGFRDEEKHGGEIGDAEEGMDIYQTVGREPWVPENKPEVIKRFKGLVPEGMIRGGVQYEHCQFSRRCNGYVYCLVEDESPNFELMSKFKHGYDTCVMIDHPELFFAELTNGLRQVRDIVAGPLVKPCRYEERIQHVIGDDPPGAGVFTKEPRFAYQREVRGCWDGKGLIKPIILKGCGAAKYCSIVCTWINLKDSGIEGISCLPVGKHLRRD